MSFRDINSKYLEPGSMWLMIFGIVALCQPWIFVLHRYGATIIVLGLICFLITSHIGPKPFVVEDEVFDVSDHREGKA
ncbi:hypothetical protein E2A64_04505 [Pseudohoeflea suaedae]|uniref:Uncharacterized protein n=1 Tax=Pseudohoeflea suaedae TaxID=877384 RepID=A0A4R5PN51_9HYPH|nr:hypothetical protein [Pseudohoeflea suaedae]TDH38379.1 hypothetical protein E2A64_04505 [Pseudohoeflea suaedae]